MLLIVREIMLMKTASLQQNPSFEYFKYKKEYNIKNYIVYFYYYALFNYRFMIIRLKTN